MNKKIEDRLRTVFHAGGELSNGAIGALVYLIVNKKLVVDHDESFSVSKGASFTRITGHSIDVFYHEQIKGETIHSEWDKYSVELFQMSCVVSDVRNSCLTGGYIPREQLARLYSMAKLMVAKEETIKHHEISVMEKALQSFITYKLPSKRAKTQSRSTGEFAGYTNIATVEMTSELFIECVKFMGFKTVYNITGTMATGKSTMMSALKDDNRFLCVETDDFGSREPKCSFSAASSDLEDKNVVYWKDIRWNVNLYGMLKSIAARVKSSHSILVFVGYLPVSFVGTDFVRYAIIDPKAPIGLKEAYDNAIRLNGTRILNQLEILTHLFEVAEAIEAEGEPISRDEDSPVNK